MSFINIITFPYNNPLLPSPKKWASNDWKNYIIISDTENMITKSEFRKIKKEYTTEWDYEDIAQNAYELESNYMIYYFYENDISNVTFCSSKKESDDLFWKEVQNLNSQVNDEEFISIFTYTNDNYNETVVSEYTSDRDVITTDKNSAIGLVEFK